MLRTLLSEDAILPFLLKDSTLTAAQLDTLLCELDGLTSSMKLRERVAKRDRKSVSLGAYLRTKKQAYARARRTIKTILLLNYLGLISQDGLPSLHRIAQLLHQINRRDLTEAEKKQVINLLEETVKRIIVISQ